MQLEFPAAQGTGPARQTVGDWWEERVRARSRRTSGPPGCTIAIASILGRMWCLAAISDDELKATSASAAHCGTHGTALCCCMQLIAQHSSRIRWANRPAEASLQPCAVIVLVTFWGPMHQSRTCVWPTEGTYSLQKW
jgi:hypothetical protein